VSDRYRAAQVGAVAELNSISLRSVDARVPELKAADGGVDLDVSWEASFERSEPTLLRYEFHLALGTTSGPDMHVDCTFELVYEVPAEVELDDEDLAAFGDVSVTFSAFPYARELVQNLTARASLPPLTLGTLRAPLDLPDSGGGTSE
jgi:preprotein translocase subunit SecB